MKKNINEEKLIWMHFGGPFLIWLIIFFFKQPDLKINFDAIKLVPTAISVYVPLFLIFKKWMWKWSLLQGWLVPFPNLNGSWLGEIKSTWKDSLGNTPPPIKAMLVIKQTFSTISCVMYTEEMDSFSTAAQIYEDDESGILRLSYNYISRTKQVVRDRSEIHDGAAILKIISQPERELLGDYWTSRKTTGDIKLKFYSKKRLEKLPE